MSGVVLVAPARCLFTPWSSSLAAIHSITSSARARSVAGTVMPSALAVFILMTSWKRVGCSTGKSAGWAPLRILSTYTAALRKRSAYIAEYDVSFVGEPARHGNRRHAVLQRQLGGALGRQAGLNDDGVGPVSLHRGESAFELLIVVNPDRVDCGSGGFAAKLDLFEERFGEGIGRVGQSAPTAACHGSIGRSCRPVRRLRSRCR